MPLLLAGDKDGSSCCGFAVPCAAAAGGLLEAGILLKEKELVPGDGEESIMVGKPWCCRCCCSRAMIMALDKACEDVALEFASTGAASCAEKLGRAGKGGKAAIGVGVCVPEKTAKGGSMDEAI